ncbi:MAG: hypothetical protein FJ206_06865 [Gemmatimonadetes bacterium]|nr:hypothetical protein [Gemmatimonadota bacterium]
MFFLSVLLAAAAPSGARGYDGPTIGDSVPVTVANRVVLDIAAPAGLIWQFLPGLRTRPGMETVSLNGLREQFGSRFDTIHRDSTGKVTRHDRIEVLHWEPGVRYVALVQYLPPASPVTIVYNVDLRETGGSTHFVMDSYATIRFPADGSESDRIAKVAAQRAEWQRAVETGYQAFKKDVEAAARAR